jgi:ParB-like chromosome segregation protein Spo0J
MKIERINVAELSLDPSNVRKHDRKNLDAIKASLRKFGQQKPIVVDAKGIVLAGNGTLTAAKELGWTEIEITRTTLQGVEATAFAIADNRSAELAEWDDSLADVLKSLSEADVDLTQLGFSDSDLDELSGKQDANESKNDVEIVSALEVIAECESEDQQKLAYDLLTEKGFKCRLVTL